MASVHAVVCANKYTIPGLWHWMVQYNAQYYIRVGNGASSKPRLYCFEYTKSIFRKTFSRGFSRARTILQCTVTSNRIKKNPRSSSRSRHRRAFQRRIRIRKSSNEYCHRDSRRLTLWYYSDFNNPKTKIEVSTHTARGRMDMSCDCWIRSTSVWRNGKRFR